MKFFKPIIINKFIESFNQTAVNPRRRARNFSLAIYVVFLFIALFMTGLNLFTERYPLMVATASYAFICIVSVLVILYQRNGIKVSSYFFGFGTYFLFLYFLITGGTDNFSVIWLLFMPSLGITFFGILNGTIYSGLVFLTMIACFYIPPIHDICTATYTKTFELRFPIVYLCSYIVALFLESMRVATEKSLIQSRKQLQYQNTHDLLTGTLNRYGMAQTFSMYSHKDINKICVAMYDIDHFKEINDKFGHLAGDEILLQLSKFISLNLPENAYLHRFGGEEFVIVAYNMDRPDLFLKKLCSLVSKYVFVIDENKIELTISIGYVTLEGNKDVLNIDRMLNIADSNLYAAKDAGRNNVIGFPLPQ